MQPRSQCQTAAREVARGGGLWRAAAPASTGANMEKEAFKKKARNSLPYTICLDILCMKSNS
jgi:hypothetical protein